MALFSAPSLVYPDPLCRNRPGIKAQPGWAEPSKLATGLNIKVRMANICHLREQLLEARGQALHLCNPTDSLKRCGEQALLSSAYR